MKMDLVNGDDTDFFHLAGHKATFFGKAFSTFFPPFFPRLLHSAGDE